MESVKDQLFRYVKKTYGVEPDCPFPTDPDCPVLRHQDNRKWFAILMDVSRDKLGLSDCVDFLGALGNPYPFFKASDLLLVPSYDEAAPMVFGEAEYFNLPILTTDTTSAKELVEDRNIGFAVENSDGALEKKLAEIMQNPGVLKAKTKGAEISNNAALLQFEKLISEG